MNTQFYNTFQEFTNKEFPEESIFRGHTNAGKFWDLTSSHQRYFHNKPFSEWQPYGFNRILHSTLISNYQSIPNFERLTELNNLDFLIYLQHYGIPTPLIDFSRSHLIALYFAGSGIHYTNLRRTFEHGERFDKIAVKIYNRRTLTSSELEELFNKYPTLFIDIIELKQSQLTILKNIELTDDFNQQLVDKCSFELESETSTVFSISNPRNTDINYNLEQQKGCFIYIDSKLSLESFIEELINQNLLSENPITHHLIPKPSLNYPDASIHNLETLYDFLSKNRITGMKLFNDLQGLKFDMNLISGK